MKCVMCNRPMQKPFLMVGGQNIGPKCAEKRGLIEKKRRRKQFVSLAVNDYDPRQMWLDLKD